jgi:regulator of protease activity HflC (stomatin/prohibitin superfamily)
MLDFLIILVIALAVVAAVVYARSKGQQWAIERTVFEWQTGLLYRDGKFEREVGPGRHWLFFNRSLQVLPKAEQYLMVNAQEVLSQDRLQFKISGLVSYTVTEPRRLFEETAGNYTAGLHTDLILGLREIAASRPLEKLIDERAALDGELLAILAPKAQARGAAIKTAHVRDLILNAETRRLYAEFERARLESVAALERARGEQAALRSLANSARLLKGNPELMNLRLLQALAGQPGKQAPTVVLGAGTGLLPVSKEEAAPEAPT